MLPVVKMQQKVTAYLEVAREETAGCGRSDVFGDGQQEQEYGLEVCERKRTEETEEPNNQAGGDVSDLFRLRGCLKAQQGILKRLQRHVFSWDALVISKRIVQITDQKEQEHH